jgi:phosphoserine phosphatase
MYNPNYMATIIFDFDSTLVSCESLEILLSEKLKGDTEKLKMLHSITEKGIDGTIPFSESLTKRLELIAPDRQEIIDLGFKLLGEITPGMETLIEDLHRNKVDVWIASGGIEESLYPVAQKLKIPLGQVLGVDLIWDESGKFIEINPNCLFAKSKVKGLKPYTKNWSLPSVIVGDSVSDFSLYESGIVNDFILFTQYYRCQKIISLGVKEARDTTQLKQLLSEILDENTTFR